MNEAQLFTVRVWRHAEQFRASVRAVGEEQAHLFTSPQPLADFLLRPTVDHAWALTRPDAQSNACPPHDGVAADPVPGGRAARHPTP